MSRWPIASLLLLALGCHKDAPPPPAAAPLPAQAVAPPPVADAGLADAPAAPRFVDLLHAVPSTVRVSSRVANPAILPAHLVDRDLATAWNSATGDLVGAWIEITVPGQATIAELRMTAGHTGKGPKGEDYFTMNPRIAKVSVARSDGTALGTFALATERRDLQSLTVKTPGGTLRIVIVEIVPGSKKSWREAAISELEVWGVPPPGFQPPPAPLTPTVEVGDPTAGTEESLDALCAARLEPIKGDSGSINIAPASCGSKEADLPGLKPPFTGLATTCVVASHGVMNPAASFDCAFAIATDRHWWSGLAVTQPTPPDDVPRGFYFEPEVFETFVVNLPDPMLVIRYRTNDKNEPERFTVCRATPRRGCSEPIQTEGADWKTRPKQVGAELVVEAQSGTPPQDELGAVTAQLRFP